MLNFLRQEYGANVSIPNHENFYLIAKNKTASWVLFSSPWPVLFITIAYLIFVARLGPQFMKNRKPLNITSIILFYNLYQAFYNAYVFSKVFTVEGCLNYLLNHACRPMEPAKNPFWLPGIESGWLYLVSKITDLLDTVFFILRKKNSHVTFLHVYHHTNMVLSTWFFLKFLPGEQLAIIGIVNSFVHVVMYTYYFLAALGPQMQKYLWWKVYITRLQMAQFLFFVLYMSSLLIAKCELPEVLSWYIIFQGVIFFLLFANFYMKTYRNPNVQQKGGAEDQKKKPKLS